MSFWLSILTNDAVRMLVSRSTASDPVLTPARGDEGDDRVVGGLGAQLFDRPVHRYQPPDDGASPKSVT